MSKCSICDHEANERVRIPSFQKFRISCERCGTYIISEEAESFLMNNSEIGGQKYILSGYTRNATLTKKSAEISTSNINDIIGSAKIPSDPLEAIDTLVLYLYHESTKKTPDSFIPLTQNDYPLIYSKNLNEFNFYIRKAIELGYIENDTYDASSEYRLTIPRGWIHISELNKVTRASNQVFIAMWFDEKVNEIWENAFKPAIKHVGFNPIRIDKTEHNEKIDDKIIADISKSALLIADLTGQRQGVYFEAGFAVGIGIPVIWTCRDDHKKKIHFDTRQYNCIFWKNPEELKEKLINRIEATILIKKP